MIIALASLRRKVQTISPFLRGQNPAINRGSFYMERKVANDAAHPAASRSRGGTDKFFLIALFPRAMLISFA